MPGDRKQVKQIRRRFEAWRKKQWEQLHELVSARRKKMQARIKQIEQQQDQPKGESFVMYDSIDLSQIPRDAKAVAGYVNGYWPTYNDLKRQWPNAKVLSIAVTSLANAECLDVEPGDATPQDAPAWVRRQNKRGENQPVIYCSVSQASVVLAELSKAGIKRDQIRLWIAHYSGRKHICDSSCGFGFTGKADATQWTDHSGGKNLDESLCSPKFLK